MQTEKWRPLQVAVDGREWALVARLVKLDLDSPRLLPSRTPSLRELRQSAPLLDLSVVETLRNSKRPLEDDQGLVAMLERRYSAQTHRVHSRRVRAMMFHLLLVTFRSAGRVAAFQASRELLHVHQQTVDSGSHVLGAAEADAENKWRRRFSSVSSWMRRRDRDSAGLLNGLVPLEVWETIMNVMVDLEADNIFRREQEQAAIAMSIRVGNHAAQAERRGLA